MFLAISHSPANQRGRQMQQAFEVGHLLFVSHPKLAVIVHPRVGSLHHPAACFAFGPMPLLGRSLPRHMRDVSAISHRLLGRFPRVTLIHAKVLRPAWRRLGPLHHDAIQRCSQQLYVVPIGSGNDKRERGATGVHQQTALGAFFSPGPSGCCRRPLAPVGLCPASRPDSATPKQSPPSRHTRPSQLATTAQKPPPVATIESGHGSRWRCQTLWAMPSTGIPSAAHTRWPRKYCGVSCAFGRRQVAAGTCAVSPNAGRALAGVAQPWTKGHPTLPMIGLSALHKTTRDQKIGSNVI